MKMKEERSIIEKIQSKSRMGMVVTNIIKSFCIVCSILMILTGGVLVAANDQINAEFEKASYSGEELEDMSPLESALLRSLLDEGDIATLLGVKLIVLSVMLIFIAVTLHFVGKVFKEIRESYSPFRRDIIKNLKVAFVLVTLLVLQRSLGIGLIVGVFLWCVIHIFEYGCELQRMSDETL